MRNAISQCLWTATGLGTKKGGNPQEEEGVFKVGSHPYVVVDATNCGNIE